MEEGSLAPKMGFRLLHVLATTTAFVSLQFPPLTPLFSPTYPTLASVQGMIVAFLTFEALKEALGAGQHKQWLLQQQRQQQQEERSQAESQAQVQAQSRGEQGGRQHGRQQQGHDDMLAEDERELVHMLLRDDVKQG
jgi:hypothetical protein